jgi:hypothetical protein
MAYFLETENNQSCAPSVKYIIAVGSNGTNEGYHYASVLMSTGGAGGKATVMTGAIYAVPLDS